MGAQRAAWTAAFQAEQAADRKLYYAQVLLDLAKAFELVPHHILVENAAHYHFPMALLRLSLAAYRLKRYVGINGVYGLGVIATRGITAGSVFATSELRLLLMKCIDSTYTIYQQIESHDWLWVYVDDITIAWVARSWKLAADRVAQVADHIVH